MTLSSILGIPLCQRPRNWWCDILSEIDNANVLMPRITSRLSAATATFFMPTPRSYPGLTPRPCRSHVRHGSIIYLQGTPERSEEGYSADGSLTGNQFERKKAV
ncbi:hypothetical protein FPOAC2_04505 [Fusarium poae]